MMQTVVCKLLRKVMMGQASREREDGSWRTISNVQVLALFDLAPLHTELAVRRLRMLAGAVRDPVHHTIFTAAMFGDMANVECPPDGPRPHLHQLISDLGLLSLSDALAMFVDTIVEYPLVLFTGPEVREAFLKVGFSEIENGYMSPAVPPSSGPS